MTRKLVEVWDPALEIEPLSEAEALARVRAAVYAHLKTAMAVTMYKRRLGGDASDPELARDKKTAREAAAVLLNVVQVVEGENKRAWGTVWYELREEANGDLEVRQQAAVVVWSAWLKERSVELEWWAKWCAGWVMNHGADSLIVRALVRQLDTAHLNLLKMCNA